MNKPAHAAGILIAAVVFIYFVPGYGEQKPAEHAVQASECGVVELVFDNSKTAYSQISFAREYSSPPLVLVSECFSAGSWIVTKAEEITPKECTICALNHNKTPVTYRANVAYVVFAPEDIRHPPTRIIKHAKARDRAERNGIRTEAELKKLLSDAIGPDKSITKVDIAGTAPRQPVVVRWRIAEVGGPGFTRDGAIFDIQNMLQAIEESGFGYATIRFEGTLRSKGVVLRADYSRQKVAKENWGDIFLQDVPGVADAWHEDPDLRK